jgi:hypothetical protein
MKFLALLSLLFNFLGASATAHAQASCPPGWMPYGTGTGLNSCGRIPGYNEQQGQQTPEPPPPQWESRSGAVAVDSFLGIIGSAVNMPSDQAAQQSALSDCHSKGGKNCTIELTYANGCGALVAGDLKFATNWGDTQNEAIAKAMKVCNVGGGKPCYVSYSACSPSVRIR